MSSITDIWPRPARGHSPLFDYQDGKGMTLHDEDDEQQIVWDLTDWLASGETVSSAAYEDHGAVTSGKSVASPQITFTISKYGYTRVTAASSNSRNITRVYYTLAPSGTAEPRDYR